MKTATDAAKSTAVQIAGGRESRLREFVNRNGTSIAAVARAARVYKAEMQDWRHCKLSDKSVMSQRIEDVLTGKTPLDPNRR